MLYVLRIYWLITILALAASLTACNDSDGMFGAPSDSASVGTKSNISIGNFDGCVSASALDTSRIYVKFAFPSGSTKMNIYRNGVLAYASNSQSNNSFVDAGLVEGETYAYTCEAIVNSLPFQGQKQPSVTTLIIHAPTFSGIVDATILPLQGTTDFPNPVFIQWNPASSSGTVAAAKYLVYAVAGNSFNWANYPNAASLPAPRKTVDAGSLNATLEDLGDQIQYTFFVRACTASNICDTNQITKAVTLPDDGLAPKTVGATAVSIDRIHNKITLTTPWSDSNGAISKRNIYYLSAAAGSVSNVPLLSDIAKPEQLLRTDNISDWGSVPSQIQISGLADNKVYHFLVRDQEPGAQGTGMGLISNNTKIVSIDVGDMTAPSFSGISALDYGDLNGQNLETTLTASWYAIKPENQDAAGAATYVIYLSDSTKNPCDQGVAQTPEIDAQFDASHNPIHLGDTLKGVISGLTSRAAYRVCVKAKDTAGNLSSTAVYREAVTRDITPPVFGGVNTFDPITLAVGWNASSSSDVSTYKVNVYVTPKGQSENPVPSVLTKSKAAADNGFTLSGADNVTYTDGDTLRFVVDACDDAADLGFAPPTANHNNCTSTTRTISSVIPDTTAPKNFQGIDPSGIQCTQNDGEMLVKWLPPSTGDWTDYAGFMIHTVDSSGNLEQPARVKVDCTNQDCLAQANGGNALLSAKVSGLVPHRTYKFYVTAYDKAQNIVPISSLDIPSHSASAQSCDYSAPSFSSGLSLSNVSGGVHLSWLSGSDNQYPLEGGVTYQLYRKLGSTFNVGDFVGAGKTCTYIKGNASSSPVVAASHSPAACYTNVQTEYEYQLLSNSTQLAYDDVQSNPSNGPKEGNTYYYLICASDASGNALCDGNKIASFTVGDITPPSLNLPAKDYYLTRDLSVHTWDISWSMADNVTLASSLSVVIKKAQTANCTLFPTWSGISPYKSGAGLTSMIGESAPAGSEGCIQYQFTVSDQASPTPNSKIDTLSVPFDNKGPTAATALQWSVIPSTATVPIVANWTPSIDPSITGQTLYVYSNTDCNPAGLLAGYPTSYSSTSHSHTVPSNLVSSGTQYTFNIGSNDNHGNTMTGTCSAPTLVDTVPSQFNSTVTVPPTLAANGSATGTITITLKNAGGAGIPAKLVSVVSSRGAPHDTITALNATTGSDGVATFSIKSAEAGTNVQVVATDVTDGNLVLDSKPFVSFTSYPTQVNNSASPATVLADNTSTFTVTTVLKDVNSNVVSGKVVSLSSDRGGDTISTLPAYCSAGICKTDANGKIEFAVKSLSVGQANLTISDDTDSVTFSGPSINFIAGPGVSLEFRDQPANTVAGQIIKNSTAGNVTVVMKDQWGHDASYFSNQKNIVVSLISSNGAPLNGTLVKQTANGLASFGDLLINLKGSSYQLQASISGSSPTISVVSAPFSVTPGAPTHLSFLYSPTTTKAAVILQTGIAQHPYPQIAVIDAGGNIVDTGAPLNITLSLSSNLSETLYCGRDGSNNPIPCTSMTVPTVNGVATFNSAFIFKATTGYVLSASSGPQSYPLLASPPSFNITTNAPHHITLTGTPNKWGTSQCSPATTITLYDVGNNLTPVTAGDPYIGNCSDSQQGLCLNINSDNAAGSAYSAGCGSTISQIRMPVGSSSVSFNFMATGISSFPTYIGLTLSDAAGIITGAMASYKIVGLAVFDYQAASYTWTVPGSATTIRAYLWGAGGGGSYCAAGYCGPLTYKNGGAGAFISDIISVPANRQLKIYIGKGAGEVGVSGSNGNVIRGLGGGKSSIQDSSAIELIAAGGGGGAASYYGSGGDAGWPNGGAGLPLGIGGTGGSQTQGGLAGSTCPAGYGSFTSFVAPGGAGTAGGLGVGGSPGVQVWGAGEGGGGYYGGGGGSIANCSAGYPNSNAAGGGGGGSSYSQGRSVGNAPSAYGLAGVDASTSGADSATIKAGSGNEYYQTGIGVGGIGTTTTPGGNGRIVIEY